jgi:hypothetical protein
MTGRLGLVGVGLVAVLLLAGCGAFKQPDPIVWSHEARADSPAYVVGDEWRYSDGAVRWFYRVTGYQDLLLITESNGDPFCGGCRYFRDGHWTVVRILSADGRDTSAAGVSSAWYSGVGYKYLDFPMHVGKEWSFEALALSASGVTALYFNRMRVEGYEKVSVKAGTFNAFRIAHYQENRRVNPPRMLHASHWWSPEARAFVKRVSHSTGWGRDFELELYTLK